MHWARCEPLVDQDSRPWRTNRSRVRVFDAAGNAIPMLMHSEVPWSPQPPPPATPPPPWMTETTVRIEELEEVKENPPATAAPVSPVTAADPAEPAAVLMLPACCSRNGCFEVSTELTGWYCSGACWKKHAPLLGVHLSPALRAASSSFQNSA